VALRWRNLSSLVQERFFVRCSSSTLVNHLEGAQHLSNKAKLTALLEHLDSGRGAPCYPRCHALPGVQSSPPTSVPGPAGAEAAAALAAAVAAMLRDVGTQLAVGALRALFGDPASLRAALDPTLAPAKAAGVDMSELDVALVCVCVGVAERWAAQLEAALGESAAVPPSTAATHSRNSRNSRHSSSRSGVGSAQRPRLSRAPGSAVLAVGSLDWNALVAPGGTVVALAQALRGRRGSRHRSCSLDGSNSRRGCGAPTALSVSVSSAATAAAVAAATAALFRLAALDVHFGLGGRGVWIVKPSGSSCGRGIVCVDSVAGVATAIAGLDFKAVVQKCANPNSLWFSTVY
jgi:hypothetical protein